MFNYYILLYLTDMSAPPPLHGSPQFPMDHSSCKVVRCRYTNVCDTDDPLPDAYNSVFGIGRHANKYIA